MENIVSDSCRWDEWRDQPEKEEWKEYIRVRNYDEWEDSHKSPHEATVLEQAETNLHGDSSLGYGLRGSRHGMSFEKSEEELLSMPLTKQYKKYFAIQKECYRPYFTECCILDDYNDLTEEQQDFLDELEAVSVWTVSLKKPEDTVSVRVAISFTGCGRDIREEGWLIRFSDSNQG